MGETSCAITIEVADEPFIMTHDDYRRHSGTASRLIRPKAGAVRRKHDKISLSMASREAVHAC